MWREHLAREERRDTLLNTINQQLSDNMSFMVASQQRNERAHQTVTESLLAITNEEQRMRQSNERHFALIEATQGSLLGCSQQLHEGLSTRSRRRRSRHPEQRGDGDGTGVHP